MELKLMMVTGGRGWVGVMGIKEYTHHDEINK